MNPLNRKALKQDAASRLRGLSRDPRILILINTGAVVLLNLLVSGLNIFLDNQIGSTGGLSGLGTRSILESIQQILSYLSTLLLPFWSAGLLYSVIVVADQGVAEPKNLLAGFRRIPALLVYSIHRTLLTVLSASLIASLAGYIFLLTPLSGSMVSLMEQAGAGGTLLSGGMVDLSGVPMQELLRATAPMFLIFLVLYLPVFAFITYSLRLCPYLIMCSRQVGGFASVMMSMRMMKSRKMQMFRLDLSYWWFYLAEGLLTVVLYLDLLLPALGVELPFSPNVMFLLLILVYGVLQTAFHLWKKLPMDTTMVLAYHQIVSENPDFKAR